MILNVSEAAANAMLDVLAGMMDGGRIELLADDGKTLAVLRLSNPATKYASDGMLEFEKIAEEDAALGQGNASSARILDNGGNEVFSCDVGDDNSEAVIKLNTTKIFRNGPVRIGSFVLVMPNGREL